MSKNDERRRKIRVPVQSKIRHSQYQVLGTPVFQENSTIDLSSGGISFETTREYQKGNLVLLEVQMSEEQLKILVCVAWVKKQGSDLFQVGAELIAVDPVHKRKMQKHLNEMIASLQSEKRKSKKNAKKKVARKAPAKKKKPTKTKKKAAKNRSR